MRQFYYAQGTDQKGPFSLEELKSKGITTTTRVWHEGLADWTIAQNIPELVQELNLIPSLHHNDTDSADAPSMFSNPFSFSGRIRRLEYGLSNIIYFMISIVLSIIIETSYNEAIYLLYFSYIPMLWFLWAQGAKRCHDRGNSGWFQLIPLYGFWMLFADGEFGENGYGENPKGSTFDGISL